MPPAKPSIVTARVRLDSAIKKLARLLDELESRPAQATDINAEERDIRICRGVRSTFTYFVDYSAWHGRAHEKQVRDDAGLLEKLFERAYELLRQSRYADAGLYKSSVDEKLQLVRRIAKQESLAGVLSTLSDLGSKPESAFAGDLPAD